MRTFSVTHFVKSGMCCRAAANFAMQQCRIYRCNEDLPARKPWLRWPVPSNSQANSTTRNDFLTLCARAICRKMRRMNPEQISLSPPPPLEDVVEENKEVAQEIRSAADELAVVHAVLATETVKPSPSEAAQQAIERTNEVRSKLEATASRLEDATEALEGHVANSNSSANARAPGQDSAST